MVAGTAWWAAVPVVALSGAEAGDVPFTLIAETR